MQNGLRLDVCWGKQEAEPNVSGHEETTGNGRREAGGLGAGVSVGGTQHSPDRKQRALPPLCSILWQLTGCQLRGFVVFQPAALLTNTSAFCVAHSYFTPFPEL